MRSIESDGTTIDDAIARALTALGAERERVKITILSSGTRGLFGFGGRKARVRATMRAPLRAWLADLASSTAVEPVAGADAPAPPPPARDPVALLGEILRRMGLRATVEDHGRGSRGEHTLDLQGPDAGVLVRGRGETLEALEHVVTRMLEREGQRGTRLVLDVAGYRARRLASLSALARRLAERVRHRGRPVGTKPLGSAERRAIHLALEGEPGVSVRSVGQGAYRRLMIIPEGRGRVGESERG